MNRYEVLTAPFGEKAIGLGISGTFTIRRLLDGTVRYQTIERDIDAIRQFRDELNAAIDEWDERERKKEERRKVLRALREAQKQATS